MKKTCNNCGELKTPSTVPYQVLADFKEMHKSTVKRLWIALIVAVALIFACNGAWLYAWMQYDYVSKTYTEEIIVEQDAKDGGNANYIGNDGDIVNGLPKGDDTQNDTEA